MGILLRLAIAFQHTAARRRLPGADCPKPITRSFNTQPPEGGCQVEAFVDAMPEGVSTHSRPKAAA